MAPPGATLEWDECDIWIQALMIAYSQIREYEDTDRHIEILKSSGAKIR